MIPDVDFNANPQGDREIFQDLPPGGLKPNSRAREHETSPPLER